MNITMCIVNIVIVLLFVLIYFMQRPTSAKADLSPIEFVHNLEHTKIIVDTDAGTDDALAILTSIQYLTKENSNTKIIGITCVNGNTELDNVKINVLKTLKVANSLEIPVYAGAYHALLPPTIKNKYYYGRDGLGDFEFLNPPDINLIKNNHAVNALIHLIPVYAGANTTLLPTSMEDEKFYGSDGLGDFEFPDPPDINLIKSKHAVNALISLVHENPGEITLIALGPLTNVALAIRMDPTFRKNLKYLIVLGGSVSGYGNISPNLEFNFMMDPVANFIVFNATDSKEISPIILMTWDTMMLHGLIDKDWRLNTLGAINNDIMDFLNKAEQISLPKNSYWLSSDTYLATTALNPSIATEAERYYISAVTEGEFRGGIIPDKNSVLKTYKNAIVITKIDKEKYKNHLLKYLQ